MSAHGHPVNAGAPVPVAGGATPLLRVLGLGQRYRLPRERLLEPAHVVQALQDVSFTLHGGRSLGVVGESGSGKSTLARLVMALERPSTGQVWLDGTELHALSAAQLRRSRAQFQMVFQDPFGSLDPRLPVGRTVAEPLRAQGLASRTECGERAAAMLEAVGLRASDAARYPHEFSGGQRQRIAIARALVTHPRLIVADEPVSALDVSVQAQVLNLMQDLQDRLGVTYLFISHDLAVVDLVCDEVLVLYQGRTVEHGSPDTLFAAAAHPYTRALMQAVPPAQPRPGGPLRSRLPAALAVASGAAAGAAPGHACPFAPRCSFRQDRCVSEAPVWRELSNGHAVACHRAEAVLATPIDV